MLLVHHVRPNSRRSDHAERNAAASHGVSGAPKHDDYDYADDDYDYDYDDDYVLRTTYYVLRTPYYYYYYCQYYYYYY